MTPTYIIRLRKRHALTKVELGKLLGQYDKGRTVAAWERGEQPPSLAAAAALRYLDAVLVALACKRVPGLVRAVLTDALNKDERK